VSNVTRVTGVVMAGGAGPAGAPPGRGGG
jgi:hypothetical protein